MRTISMFLQVKHTNLFLKQKLMPFISHSSLTKPHQSLGSLHHSLHMTCLFTLLRVFLRELHSYIALFPLWKWSAFVQAKSHLKNIF